MMKCITNEQGFFDVETLEFDVLYKNHDIYFDYHCFQKLLSRFCECNRN